MYINFEGPDGSGKTTVQNIITEHLKEQGINVYSTKEPKGIFRDIVLDKDNKYGLNEFARMFIYQADRAIQIEDLIWKVRDYDMIISDRGPLSTFVYQNITTGLSIEELYSVTKIANQNFWPDLFIVFDCDYETASKRMDGRELDYFDSKGKDFYNKLAMLYRTTSEEVINNYGFDVRIVNARKSLNAVVKEVSEIINGVRHIR